METKEFLIGIEPNLIDEFLERIFKPALMHDVLLAKLTPYGYLPRPYGVVLINNGEIAEKIILNRPETHHKFEEICRIIRDNIDDFKTGKLELKYVKLIEQ